MTRLVALFCMLALSAGGAGVEDVRGVFPPDVRTIGIASASSLISRNALVAGTNLLCRAGYRVKVMPNVLKMEPADVRARLFEQAWLDPEIDFIIMSRGGHGASNVIDRVDWERLKSRKMRVMGFSDVTLVLGAMLSKGAGSPISGPMLGSLASGATKESCEWLRGVLGDGAPPPLRLRPVKPCGAAVSGKPFGGLVSRFPVLLGKGLLPSFEGRVVFMECTPRYAGVSESILDGLAAKGLFDKAAAVVFCDFNREWEKPRVDALFAAFAAKVKCPVFAGFPYGHIPGSFAIDFTRPLSISADGVLEWKARGK